LGALCGKDAKERLRLQAAMILSVGLPTQGLRCQAFKKPICHPETMGLILAADRPQRYSEGQIGLLTA